MALSGSATKAIGSHWFLDIEWTATQSIANNTSTITAKLYWRCDSYGAVSSSATKTGDITIDGSVSSFSGAGLASLSANQKKLLHTYTKTVTHLSNGTRTVVIDGMFDMDVTLGGTTYSNQTVSDGTQTLNTIPRESTLTSSASWTFPNNVSYTIDENSTSFTHKIEVFVDGSLKKTISNITGTTGTISFSTAENQSILAELNQNTTSWNKATILRLHTYNSATQDGTTLIGSNDKTGTCSSPSVSTIGVPTSFNIGDAITYDINGEANSGFHYDLTVNLGTYTKTLLSKIDPSVLIDIAWNTTTDKTALMGGLPTANSGTATWTLTTYYDNAGTYTKIRNSTTATSTVTIATADRNASWTDNMTWADINSTTTNVTGNPQYIVPNKSTLEFTLNAVATPSAGTTIKQYEVTLLGYTKPLPSTATVGTKFPTFTASELNTQSNIPVAVKVVDNRNNITQFNKTVNVVPYLNPVIASTPTRANGFDNNTTISFSTANISLMTIGTDKNSVLNIANPSTAPTLTMSANAGSTVQVATHYVTYTWVTPYGETLPSPQQSLAVTTGQNLVVTIPAKPVGVTQANIYISTTNGVGYLQGNTTGTAYTRTTAVALSGTQKPTKYSASGLRYRFKESTASWTGVPYYSFAFTMSGANLTVTSVTESLNNQKAWDIELSISDKLSTTTIVKTVPVGLPVMFMDSVKKSIGINMFPVNNDSFEVGGDVYITKNGFGGLFIKSTVAGSDPEIHLQSVGGDWSIRNDDSASSVMDLRFDNASKFVFYTDGSAKTRGNFTTEKTSPAIVFSDTDPSFPQTNAITTYQDNLQVRVGANSTANMVGMFTNKGYMSKADQWNTSGLYGIHMNNSDIIGVNGIWMNDMADSTSEGIMFLKTGATIGSTAPTDYTQLAVNGDGNVVVGRVHQGMTLWTSAGGSYMGNTQSAVLKINGTGATVSLDECPTGIVLRWERYTEMGYATYQFIPKDAVPSFIFHIMPAKSGWTGVNMVTKILTLSADKTTLTGHVDNDVGGTTATGTQAGQRVLMKITAV